jgi:hypothetical protein
MGLSEETISKIKECKVASSLLQQLSIFKTTFFKAKPDHSLQEIDNLLKVVSSKDKISLAAHIKLKESKEKVEPSLATIKEINKNIRKPVVFIHTLPRTTPFSQDIPEMYIFNELIQ